MTIATKGKIANKGRTATKGKAKANIPLAIAPKGKPGALPSAKAQLSRGAILETQRGLARLAYSEGKLSDAIMASIAKIGQAKAKNYMMAGWVAATLYGGESAELTDAQLTKALAVLKAKGKGTKAKRKPGQAVRTEKEEKAYGAARARWSYYLKRLKIKADDARGGARRIEPRAAQGAVTKGPQAPISANEFAVALPKTVTKESARAYLVAQSSILMMFANKHSGLIGMTDAKAVAAFHKAINAKQD